MSLAPATKSKCLLSGRSAPAFSSFSKKIASADASSNWSAVSTALLILPLFITDAASVATASTLGIGVVYPRKSQELDCGLPSVGVNVGIFI